MAWRIGGFGQQQTKKSVTTGTNLMLDDYEQDAIVHYHHIPAFINFGLGILTFLFGLVLSGWTSQEFFYWLFSFMSPDDHGIFHVVCILGSVAFAIFIVERLQHNQFRASGAYETLQRQHADQTAHGNNRISFPKKSVIMIYSALMSKQTRLFFVLDIATDAGGYVNWGWPGITASGHIDVTRLLVGIAVSLVLALASFVAGHTAYVQCWHYWDYAIGNWRRSRRIKKEAEADLNAYLAAQKTTKHIP